MQAIFFVFLSFTVLFAQSQSIPEIRIDQAGYLPDAPKFAAFAGNAETFQVKQAGSGKTVLDGKLAAAANDSNSGESLRLIDFSTLRQAGRYYIEIAGAGRSHEFEIGPAVYRRAWYLAMRSFYGQRCGTKVDLGPEFPGFRYDECHRRGEWHASSGKSGARESARGWHDAGDYGRYIVNSGITTGTLLWAFELYGDRVKKLSLKLPESGNGTPDMLNEIRWNLEWMLSMQDAASGGVWHKQTSPNFAGFVMPEKDTMASVVVGTGAEPFQSTCATADFAAVMAIAARVYQPYDKAFAARAREAAGAAWKWAEAHPDVRFRNPNGVRTGEYGDGNCADERLWASAEWWRTTGDKAAHESFLKGYRESLANLAAGRVPSWNSVGNLGLWAYALAGRSDGNAEARTAIREATIDAARGMADRIQSNPYRVAMRAQDFVWGSNSVALNHSLSLLIAARLDPKGGFEKLAWENLHYVLGRNAFSTSWVTGVGSKWYQHPHHRPSGADGIAEPWPGLLSGGPNQRKQDPAMRKLADGLPPMRMWIDDQESYASNEVAINWNAPLVFVLSAALPAEGAR